jgi:hypothetical protein
VQQVTSHQRGPSEDAYAPFGVEWGSLPREVTPHGACNGPLARHAYMPISWLQFVQLISDEDEEMIGFGAEVGCRLVDRRRVHPHRMKFKILFPCLCLCIVAALIVYGRIVYAQLSGWSERGQFGDMFGALNALFTGLAFAGTIAAVLLQNRQLQQQERELEISSRQQFMQVALEGRENIIHRLEKIARLRSRLYVLWRLSHYVDAQIRKNVPPLQDSTLKDFLRQLQSFVHEDMPVMLAYIGPDSKEEDAFKYLDNLFWTAEEGNRWMHYEEFTKDYFGTIATLIESARDKLYQVQRKDQEILENLNKQI